MDGREILKRLSRIEIQTWSYKSQDETILHMGPTAQDFATAFGVGEDDRHITTVDADGVALAAIQNSTLRFRRFGQPVQKGTSNSLPSIHGLTAFCVVRRPGGEFSVHRIPQTPAAMSAIHSIH